jgi:hypothetical protein
VETKPIYLGAPRRGLYEYGTITRRDDDTLVFAGCVVTRGVVDMQVGAGGSDKGTIRLQYVLVWSEQGGTWRLSLRQATRIPT